MDANFSSIDILNYHFNLISLFRKLYTEKLILDKVLLSWCWIFRKRYIGKGEAGVDFHQLRGRRGGSADCLGGYYHAYCMRGNKVSKFADRKIRTEASEPI